MVADGMAWLTGAILPNSCPQVIAIIANIHTWLSGDRGIRRDRS